MATPMERAIAIAGESSHQYKVGAVVVDKRGKVLASACNTTKTHTIMHKYACMCDTPDRIQLHAEIRALLKVRNGRAHTIYLARLGKRGELLPIHPCPMCVAYMKDVGVVKVVCITAKVMEI